MKPAPERLLPSKLSRDVFVSSLTLPPCFRISVCLCLRGSVWSPAGIRVRELLCDAVRHPGSPISADVQTSHGRSALCSFLHECFLSSHGVIWPQGRSDWPSWWVGKFNCSSIFFFVLILQHCGGFLATCGWSWLCSVSYHKRKNACN